MNTTLNLIRGHSPCRDGWYKLLAYLGKTKADDDALSIRLILEANGLDDALWCLRAVPGHEKEKRLLAVSFARRVQHLNDDPRVGACLDTAEKFAVGTASPADLAAAKKGAGAAALASWEDYGAAWGPTYAAWAALYAADEHAAQGARYAAGRVREAAGCVREAAGYAVWLDSEKDLLALLDQTEANK